MDVVGKTRVLLGKLMRVAAEPEPEEKTIPGGPRLKYTVAPKIPGVSTTGKPTKRDLEKTTHVTTVTETESDPVLSALERLIDAHVRLQAVQEAEKVAISQVKAPFTGPKGEASTKAEEAAREAERALKKNLGVMNLALPVLRRGRGLLVRYTAAAPSRVPSPQLSVEQVLATTKRVLVEMGFDDVMDRLEEALGEAEKGLRLKQTAEGPVIDPGTANLEVVPYKYNMPPKTVEPSLTPRIEFPEREGSMRVAGPVDWVTGIFRRVVGWFNQSTSDMALGAEQLDAILEELETGLGTSDMAQGPVGV